MGNVVLAPRRNANVTRKHLADSEHASSPHAVEMPRAGAASGGAGGRGGQHSSSARLKSDILAYRIHEISGTAV